MSKQHQKESTKQNQKRSKNNPAVNREQTQNQATPEQIPDGLVGTATDISIQGQAVRLGDARFSTAQHQAMATHIGQVGGNQYLQKAVETAKNLNLTENRVDTSNREVSKPATDLSTSFIQRSENTDQLRNHLEEDNEKKAIKLIKQLDSSEKQEVLQSRDFKDLAIDAFWNEEMYKAMQAMQGDLYLSLQWMFDEGANDWDWIRNLILHAPSGHDQVRSNSWMRDQFVDMCDDEEMITATRLLGSSPAEKADWLAAEGVDAEPLYEAVIGSLKMPDDITDVWEVLLKLPRNYRDDIAYHFVKNLADDEISTLSQNGDGRQALTLILAEMADGWSRDAEEEQRDRIMGLIQSDGPDLEKFNEQTEARTEAKEAQASEATQLIEDNTSFGNLDEAALGKELLEKLPSQAMLVEQVLDTLGSTNRDDVSLELFKAATDEAIKSIAGDSTGRETLLRMIQEMYLGDMSDDERSQMQRGMQLISEVDKEQGQSVEVEVITYLYGGSLDVVGEIFAGGSRGHTAIAIGDRVYSFELGWSCGRTKEEYLATNSLQRDGMGQVLEVTEEDAYKIQANLDASCGTGAYAISGDICTDSTAKALEGVLQNLDSGWNPQRFVGYLEETGQVKSYNFYPKQETE